MPVGVTERSRVDALGFVRVRVAGRYLELQKIQNLQQPVPSSIRLELRDLGELEKVVDIADKEFAERRGDQVAAGPVCKVEAYRHAPDIGPSIMLLQAAQSRWRSASIPDGLSVEVLCDAIGARHVRRHEFALHAHADRVNRPPLADGAGKLSMMTWTSCFATDASTMPPLHHGRTAEDAVGARCVAVVYRIQPVPLDQTLHSIAGRMCDVVHKAGRMKRRAIPIDAYGRFSPAISTRCGGSRPSCPSGSAVSV